MAATKISFKPMSELPEQVSALIRRSTVDGTSTQLRHYHNIVVESHGGVVIYYLNEADSDKFKGVVGRLLYLRSECYIKNGEVIKNRWNS